MSRTDAEVQGILGQAIVVAQDVLEATFDDAERAKHELLITILKLYKLYSKSSNNIPVLQGLGLKEVLTVADSVIEGAKLANINFSGALVKSLTFKPARVTK